MLATNKSSRLVLSGPPMSIATRVFGPRPALKGTLRGLEAAKELEPLPLALKAALIAPVAGILLLGIFPAALLEFAIRSAKL